MAAFFVVRDIGMPEFMSLRINPGVTSGSMESLLLAGKDAKFGVPWERAVDAYSFVATVWQNADAGPLRDAAKEASDALTRLDSDGRMRAQLSGVKR